jgi:rhodanese-related sulfurtransferase
VNRVIEGEIPGAIVIDRNVLEWRLDPASEARVSFASYDAWIVLFCNEGYASSLAADSLRTLGISRATDLIGGYRAWRAEDLPILNS